MNDTPKLDKAAYGGSPGMTCWAVRLRWVAMLPVSMLALLPAALIGEIGYAVADLIDSISGKIRVAGRRGQARRNHWILTGKILRECPACGSFRRIDNGAACGSCGIDLPNTKDREREASAASDCSENQSSADNAR